MFAVRASTVLVAGLAVSSCSTATPEAPPRPPFYVPDSYWAAQLAGPVDWASTSGYRADPAGEVDPGGQAQRLSATGLFSGIAADGSLVLGDGVQPFEPRYPLWSDGAGKARWVYLPPGKQIDTTDPDHWRFPPGTKLWKEFALEGKRVETRLIEQTGPGPDELRFATYQWADAPTTDAALVPEGDIIIDANGTSHDIPSVANCHRCHDGLREHVLGFSALQLQHEGPGLTLRALEEQGAASVPIPLDIGFPGDAGTQAALGYLHANCGNCHNDSPGIPLNGLPAPQMYLRVLVADRTPEATGAYRSAVNQRITKAEDLGFALRIRGGDATQSALHHRMSLRATEDQMPPIATELSDATGIAAIDAWIATLPAPTP